MESANPAAGDISLITSPTVLYYLKTFAHAFAFQVISIILFLERMRVSFREQGESVHALHVLFRILEDWCIL